MFMATLHSDFWSVFLMPWFWCAFLSWMTAQCIKMMISFATTHRFDFAYLMSTGGMPSAHSALVTGLSVGIGLTEGFDTPVAMLSMAFAAITMFDAATVRRAAGLQARALNRLVEQFRLERRVSWKPLRELLGHTRLEVFWGLITGIVVAICVVNAFVKAGWYTVG